MKLYLQKILRKITIAVLKKYQPKIIGITGSVGKTSTSEAVFSVLAKEFKVRKNEKNYNNEVGIPLTVLGVQSGGRNPFRWLIIFLKAIYLLIVPCRYPEILILEMAVDRPGDMKYLVDFIPLEVGVLTNISESHLEFFKNVKNIVKEKKVLIKSIPEDGLAILNTDNEHIKKLSGEIKNCETVKIGFDEDAQARAENIHFVYDENGKNKGLSFKLSYQKKNIPIRLPNIVAKHQIYTALVATVIGVHFGINIVDIAKALKQLETLPGRMKILAGVKNSLLLDDTYNASPVSTQAALETLRDLKAKRRLAVLGDMLELGESSEDGHRKIIQFALENRVDALILIGERMEAAAREFLQKDIFARKIFIFSNPISVGEKLVQTIQAGDVVLVKGSQGMRMEKVLEKIIANPKNAKKILCRQSSSWRRRQFIK